ncbi:diaminopimelate epimerase [Sphingomonas sp.]|jgi:diaminopimelate epimerase|uniref:diaminopimelate epimerase n=1 Tax=Sphingomonas sp. TaxID=28214 RepID=UPI002DE4C087|nr:diaminopimelate epimerase [Sphingomonas sp.]HEV2568908.1 diaminopimelate epimerase [Sphingomonas sp.]
MRFAFHKMHGLGNDFVVIDARAQAIAMDASRARAIADRHRGIGCDQLILLEPSDQADLRMRIFNADGAEVEQCGNALRCVASLTGAERIQTQGGLVSATAAGGLVSIDMGAPRFGWDEIPLAYPADTADLPMAWGELAHGVAVSVGNPHIIFFVPDLDAVPLAKLGPEIEHDPVFPERVNVNVAQVTGPSSLRLRVWERGAGLTQACGTGACATAVAAIRRKLVQSPVTVSLPGGDLIIAWAPGETIRMSGPANHVFTGEAELEAFG